MVSDEMRRLELLEDAMYRTHEHQARGGRPPERGVSIECCCEFCDAYRDRRPLMPRTPALPPDELARASAFFRGHGV